MIIRNRFRGRGLPVPFGDGAPQDPTLCAAHFGRDADAGNLESNQRCAVCWFPRLLLTPNGFGRVSLLPNHAPKSRRRSRNGCIAQGIAGLVQSDAELAFGLPPHRLRLNGTP